MIRVLFVPFFAFISLCTHLFGSDLSIVFIHIGKPLPTYLEIAVEQARLFNPNTDIYVIGNYRALRLKRDFFRKQKIKAVTCESLKMSTQHREFLKKTKIDTSFRNGFWKYAIERFFYLDELMHQHELKHVFHLETDVMLYEDVSSLLPILEKHYEGIAATFDNDERCIAGLIYFSGIQASQDFCRYMVKTAKKNYNDMDVLSHYRKESKPTKIVHLPIVMNTYEEIFESAIGLKVSNPQLFSNHFDQFTSLFDAAALGQYLGGEDPRNGSRGPGFINERCVFNPSKFQFCWKEDAKGRKVPYASYQGKEYRINNLHIHSKNLKKFRSWD